VWEAQQLLLVLVVEAEELLAALLLLLLQVGEISPVVLLFLLGMALLALRWLPQQAQLTLFLSSAALVPINHLN
jgi:hypothetical protein